MVEFQTIPAKLVLLAVLLATIPPQLPATPVPMCLAPSITNTMVQTHAIHHVPAANTFLHLCLTTASCAALPASPALSLLKIVLTLTVLSTITISITAVSQCVHQAIILIHLRDSALPVQLAARPVSTQEPTHATPV